MNKNAREFLDEWLLTHIVSLSHDENDTEAKGSARMCLADAERKGISPTEIMAIAGGDLVAFMAREITKVVELEAKRLP